MQARKLRNPQNEISHKTVKNIDMNALGVFNCPLHLGVVEIVVGVVEIVVGVVEIVFGVVEIVVGVVVNGSGHTTSASGLGRPVILYIQFNEL